MRASALVLLFLAIGCAPAVSPVDARLVECGLATDGEIGPTITSAFYQPSDCYRDCLAGATCDELQDTLCRTSIELLQRCDARCAHRCPDGALIAIEAVCDGIEQCDGGSDESSCGTFRCNSGMELSGAVRCNGRHDCLAGEDERDCGDGELTCTGMYGETVYGSWYRCDGYRQCRDGEDEADCPVLRCSDGQMIPHREDFEPRCDGYPICRDGSDEEGCSRLTPMCEAS